MKYRIFVPKLMLGMFLSLSVAACQDSSSSGGESSASSTTPVKDAELLVSLPAANTVQRIRISDGATVAQFEVGMLPHDFLSGPNDNILYLVLVGSQAVAEIDVAQNRVLRTFLTEPVPTQRTDGTIIQGHIEQNAFAHTTCFDCHHGGASGVKPAVVGSRPLGIAWNATHDALLVTNSRTSTLAVIDVATGQLRRTVSLAPGAVAHEPAALAATPDRIVVALRPAQPSFDPSSIVVMSANDFSVLSKTAVGSNANHVVADEYDRAAYVSDFESNTITRIGLDAGDVAKFTVGNGPLGVRTLQASTLLAANYYQNSVSLVTKATGVSSEIPLRVGQQQFSNPSKIGINAARTFAYVVASGTAGDVLELDLRRNEFVRAFDVGGLPFDVTMVPSSVVAIK